MSYSAQINFSDSSHLEYIPLASEIYDDQRTLFEKTVDRSFSLLRETHYGYRKLRGCIIDYFNPSFDQPEVGKSWRTESEGLYVLIHGLNGHPSIWESQMDQLKSEKNKDLFIPYVPLRGNGPLEEVANPILRVIEDYTSSHPSKPICLIGYSNGGRICTWLETRLRSSAPTSPIKISTIAAIHFGSSRMDLVKSCHQWTGWSLGYNLSVVNDLCFGSEKAKEILKAVRFPLKNGVIRDFEFFASTEDLQVPEISSSIPKLGKNLKATYRVIHGYDHGGIVAGVSVDQIRSCEEWMNKFSS